MNTARGFTLLELLTTIAIISLLIMVAYPIYTQHTLKTRRAQAQIGLLNVASALEQYHAIHNTYKDATLDNLQISTYTESKNYRLDITNAVENGYVIKAVPQGVQVKDKLCGVLSLDAVGKKKITGNGNVEDCW